MTFKVGDEVWLASYAHSKKTEPCPVCFGKKKVTVILGDSSCVDCPCEYCRIGFNASSGVIKTHIREAKATRYTIQEVRRKETARGEECEYLSTTCHILKEENMFAGEEAAKKKAAELAKAATEAEFVAMLRRKSLHETNRSYSWGIGYHKREAARLREQAEYHERLCVTCKQRARPRKAEVKS